MTSLQTHPVGQFRPLCFAGCGPWAACLTQPPLGLISSLIGWISCSSFKVSNYVFNQYALISTGQFVNSCSKAVYFHTSSFLYPAGWMCLELVSTFMNICEHKALLNHEGIFKIFPRSLAQHIFKSGRE